MSTQVRKLTKSETAMVRREARLYAGVRIVVLTIVGAFAAFALVAAGWPVVLAGGVLLALPSVLYIVIVLPEVTHRFDWREMEDWYQQILWGKDLQPK